MVKLIRAKNLASSQAIFVGKIGLAITKYFQEGRVGKALLCTYFLVMLYNIDTKVQLVGLGIENEDKYLMFFSPGGESVEKTKGKAGSRGRRHSNCMYIRYLSLIVVECVVWF